MIPNAAASPAAFLFQEEQPAAMARKTQVFSCTDCGAQSPKWLGRCPECGAWSTLVEEAPSSGRVATGKLAPSSPIPISEIDGDDVPRISTSMVQFDRVLGGGIVPGGVTLIAGEPGIGKSTLLLQISHRLASLGKVLYVSGEESPRQIALRARRLDTFHERIELYAETSVERIVAQVESSLPIAVIVDSIQTVHAENSSGAAGSVAQVREAAGLLMSTAKRLAIPVFLIGHITKEGTIAGPKALEHIVDTVLYFEGDRLQNQRLVRAFKNRFGPVNEVAIYRMHDNGLEEVQNASEALISQRSTAPGSAIAVTMEGTRALLVEVQALVSASQFPTPRRVAMGIDSNRLSILLAVLEKTTGETFLSHDVYLNIAGGIELEEPAVDLAIVAALVSSKRNRAMDPSLAVFGEVGLLGEVRGVSQPGLRAKEAKALGFEAVVLPSSNAGDVRGFGKRPVRTVEEAIRAFVPIVG
jgi:DNA repair protein RadA/Sms